MSINFFLPICIGLGPTYMPGTVLGVGGHSKEQNRQKFLPLWSLQSIDTNLTLPKQNHQCL